MQRSRPSTQIPRRSSSCRLLASIVFWSVISTIFLHHYVFAVYVIRGSSMLPTLKDGDTALVNMLVQRLGEFERGEIVLVRDGFRDYATKRIVGLPGERIDIRDGKVFVNGRFLPERYLARDMQTSSDCPTFRLGSEQYLVLGDNRADSYDGRHYGPLARNAIVGSYSRSFWACR